MRPFFLLPHSVLIVRIYRRELLTRAALVTLLMAAVFGGVAFTASTAQAAPAFIAISNGVSDNYKASYNANPNNPELRTWLSYDSITAGGAVWRPQNPAAILTTKTLPLYDGRGRAAYLSVRVLRGSVNHALTVLRYDPDGRWGPLLTLSDRSALPKTPLLLELKLTGSVTAAGYTEYRSATFSGAGSAIENNGPLGRWFIGGKALPTDWENRPSSGVIVAKKPVTKPVTKPAKKPPARRVIARPSISRIQLPVRSKKRVVVLRVMSRPSVKARKVTHVRVQIGKKRFSRWHPVAKGYRVVLPKANGAVRVRVQVRETGGRSSLIKQRYVRCSCR